MNRMRFDEFLKRLGYSDELISKNLIEDTFTYPVELHDPEIENTSINRLDLKYVYTPTKHSIFETHSLYWNRNDVNVFIAVSDDKCHIINAKEKPDEENPLKKNIIITSFNYGINSEGFEKENLKEISKEQIDSTYFFDFVTERQKTLHEVDKDLLLNLIALRNDLINNKNEKIVHLLILRCLFIKYLEDRKIYSDKYLLNILQSESPERLVKAFNEMQKINGDIFKNDALSKNDIKKLYLRKLAIFFSSDYRSGQRRMFPYKFDQIPVQLISNVYEAFLKSEEKKGRGIYYTPSFIVNFMLAQTLKEKLTKNREATVLDPACGSGAFLVESFKMIVDSYPQKPEYEIKKKILENRLFGIDVDPEALRITAFSLYLVLLETEDPGFIRHEIEHAHPILPTLIGKTLIHGNALINTEIFKDRTFDCIVGNPPWGSVSDNDNEGNREEREAIQTKGKEGTMPIYKNVADYERSQAYVLRVGGWSSGESTLSLIVKNSNFLNENAGEFRHDFLNIYRLTRFYELSGYDKILFKKRVIGEIAGKKIEIGAVEPCVVLVFDKKDSKNNIVNYISPQLNRFSEKFQLIHFTQKDINRIQQADFLNDDLLWRVLVNGSLDDYSLIKKRLYLREGITIECRSGFQPKKDMESFGIPVLKKLIEPADFTQYQVKKKLTNFNWNQELRRKPEAVIFNGNRILIPVRPLKSDNFRFRGIRLHDNIIHKHNILCMKIKSDKGYIEEYAPYLTLINSKLLGYYFYQVSAQWGKGEGKRSTLRNSEVEELPLVLLDDSDHRVRELTGLVGEIEEGKKNNRDTAKLEKKVDEIVFELYGLLEFEKEMIREFYQVRVERKNDRVKDEDIQLYADRFRTNFKSILAHTFRLNAEYRVSPNIGAAIRFRLVDEKDYKQSLERKDIPFLDVVKKKQLQQSYFAKMLNEDKIKIYDNNCFYIIKSNYFKDWTERQAMKDANEEIGLLLKNLPGRDEIG